MRKLSLDVTVTVWGEGKRSHIIEQLEGLIVGQSSRGYGRFGRGKRCYSAYVEPLEVKAIRHKP